jgi:hypothetical protein
VLAVAGREITKVAATPLDQWIAKFSIYDVGHVLGKEPWEHTIGWSRTALPSVKDSKISAEFQRKRLL